MTWSVKIYSFLVSNSSGHSSKRINKDSGEDVASKICGEDWNESDDQVSEIYSEDSIEVEDEVSDICDEEDEGRERSKIEDDDENGDKQNML